MDDLLLASASTFKDIRFVLTDMDETLTLHGRLSAQVYRALERLQRAGLKVIPVTAAPAGWCDQMARMWPVDGVIAENGGLYITRSDTKTVERIFWEELTEQALGRDRLIALECAVKKFIPSAVLADDQPFRLTSLAFVRPDDAKVTSALCDALVQSGARATCNNLWVLGWIGEYDKLAMSQRILAQVFRVEPERMHSVAAYCGDSENDASMFGYFDQTFGMSTVRDANLSCLPRWITRGPGGEGFIEAADAIIRSRIGDE